ncbi:MAG: hypothetical protein HKN79_11975 [Flavobacteriales bacterium]|nr:hypothetical protein [Flavobacteriales bacterium]
MKKILLNILIPCLFSGALSAQVSDLGIALFDTEDYQGQHVFITEDWDPGLSNIPFGIESIRVPKGWEIWVYQGEGFSGRHRALTSNWDGNGKHDWRWKNEIRSIRIITEYRPNPLLQALTSTKGVAVFTRTEYRGDHKFITSDWTSAEGCFSFGIESIRIPAQWEVWVYEGDNFTGRHMKLTEDWDGMGKNDWRWRDDIRSLRVIRSTIGLEPDVPARPSIQIYEHADRTGASFELTGEWSALGSDDFWNDRISSIVIPQGIEVHVFEHTGYRGKVKILKRDWRAKEPDHFWNDRISSIKVITRDYVMY